MTDFTDTLEAALWAAGRGWKVHDLDHPNLPTCAGIRTRSHDPATCTKRGKHPCGKFSQTATSDPAAVTAMFAGTTRNVGIAAGDSGLLIIDEDVIGAFAQLAHSLGHIIPDTFTVTTSRGLHYYFEQPDVELGNAEGLLKGTGCNVRGAGGYVVGPGSLHESGVRYLPDDPDKDVLPCPDWLVTALTTKAGGKQAEPFDWDQLPQKHKGPIADGDRHPTLLSYAGRLRSLGLDKDEAEVLFRRRFEDCEQPPGHIATWESAKAAILDDVFERYTPSNVPADYGVEDTGTGRRLVLTKASTIQPQRVGWLWEGRLALGTLGLLAGREGQGKSTITAWLIAQVTRGLLPGEYLGQPRPVFVCATEDSWEHTIVPRLIAAGADLDLVLRLDVITSAGTGGVLGLPRDIPALQASALDNGAAMLVLDPLTSRLSDTLDTHKDADTRQALEPLVAMAHATRLAVVGLMHFNKGSSTDPVNAVMASRAFTAVARSVHTVVRDPDDEQVRYFATPKNNLGRDDLPMLGFTIAGHSLDTDDGTAWTSKVVWGAEVEGSVAELMERAAQGGDRSSIAEATGWLKDYMETEGGRAESSDIKRAGAAAGHSQDSLKRARRRLGLTVKSVGFPRKTWWAEPPSQSEQQSEQVRGDSLTALTAPTEAQSVQSVQSVQSEDTGHDLLQLAAPTGMLDGFSGTGDASVDPWPKQVPA